MQHHRQPPGLLQCSVCFLSGTQVTYNAGRVTPVFKALQLLFSSAGMKDKLPDKVGRGTSPATLLIIQYILDTVIFFQFSLLEYTVFCLRVFAHVLSSAWSRPHLRPFISSYEVSSNIMYSTLTLSAGPLYKYLLIFLVSTVGVLLKSWKPASKSQSARKGQLTARLPG